MSNEKEIENSPCYNCDSKSMEECLLIRHCKNWCIRKEDKEDDE